MRKVLIVMLSFLLFLPLTLHGSNAYFTDSKNVGVNISAAEESPYFLIQLLSEGATSFNPPISSGSNDSFRIDWYRSINYGNSWVNVGTIVNHSDIALRIEFAVLEGNNLFDFLKINNLAPGTSTVVEMQRKNSAINHNQLTVQFTVYDNQGIVLLVQTFPIYVYTD